MAFLQMKSVIFPVHRTKKKRGAEKPKTLYSLEGLYDKTLESKNGGGSKLSGAENPNRNNAGYDLLEAARYDDFDDIASLASSGVSLDSKDSLGRTGMLEYNLQWEMKFRSSFGYLFRVKENGRDYIKENARIALVWNHFRETEILKVKLYTC